MMLDIHKASYESECTWANDHLVLQEFIQCLDIKEKKKSL